MQKNRMHRAKGMVMYQTLGRSSLSTSMLRYLEKGLAEMRTAARVPAS